MALRLGGMVIVAALAALPAFADNFETRLSPSPLTEGTRANVTGEGHVSAILDGSSLTLRGDFHGLASNATTAELDDGAGIAIPGPKAFALEASRATAGSVTGQVTLNAKQIAALRAGHLYVQINSEKASDGNLAGWLLPPHSFAGEDVPVAGAGFLPQFEVKK